jgi:hypothetical protein
MSGSLFKSLQGFKEDAPIAFIEGRSKPEVGVAPNPINIFFKRASLPAIQVYVKRRTLLGLLRSF